MARPSRAHAMVHQFLPP